MDAKEIVRILRISKCYPHEVEIFDQAADLIESQEARLAENDKFFREWCSGEDQYQETVCQLECARIRISELKAELAASQRREQAAVEDLSTYKDCGFCIHLQDQQYCYKNCQRHVDVDNFRTHPCWQWRGQVED